MPRINPVLFVIVFFAAGFAVAYSISSAPEIAQTEGKALIGGPFALIGTDGKRVTDRDFRGKLMLVFFGYTHCPDVCPTELQNMAEVLDALGTDANRVVPVFISVDAKRDTPKVLSDYLRSFSPRITGLTGSPDEVASAAKAYRVYFREVNGIPGDYSVDHSAFVYLMDGEGNYLSHFMFNTPAATMANVIRKQF